MADGRLPGMAGLVQTHLEAATFAGIVRSFLRFESTGKRGVALQYRVRQQRLRARRARNAAPLEDWYRRFYGPSLDRGNTAPESPFAEAGSSSADDFDPGRSSGRGLLDRRSTASESSFADAGPPCAPDSGPGGSLHSHSLNRAITTPESPFAEAGSLSADDSGSGWWSDDPSLRRRHSDSVATDGLDARLPVAVCA
jgi:hypothetical protein